MATPAEILAEEQALGRWPRRLLHVDTLISYEWQPGNRYGAATEPKYSAVTYTWGRWKLKENEMPSIGALPVRGVPWDVPRVNPARFTVQELRDVINRARTSPPMPLFTGMSTTAEDPGGLSQRVDLVWLDVACIDQRENSPRAASEMGRQAAIFRHASFVYAWLSTIPARQLTQLGAQRSFHEALRTNPETALQVLSGLTSDPWFSSLWTLQEAFLRTDAVFLSREAALAATRSPSGMPEPQECFTLSAAIFSANEVYLSAEDPDWPPAVRTAHRQALDLAVRTGLYSLSLRNPVATYILAKHRQAERTEDRVYGIQQIFNLRLGKTAPGWGRGGGGGGGNYSVVSLAELEDELAAALLARYPIQSQMHVFTEPAAEGTAWRISASSALPKMNERYFPWQDAADIIGNDMRGVSVPTCRLWAQRDNTGSGAGTAGPPPPALRGYFRGRACNLALFKRRWDEEDAALVGLWDLPQLLTVFLDAAPDEPLASCPDREAPASVLRRQRDLMEWLVREFPGPRMKVLQLGSRHFASGGDEPEHDLYRLIHGLLLVPKPVDGSSEVFYRRVGFCTWYASSFPAHREHEWASEWETLSGRFG